MELSPRQTRLGIQLEQAARDILVHVKGEKTFPTRQVMLPDEVDVKPIRESANMS